jgi:o-succinylbenzoate synthase
MRIERVETTPFALRFRDPYVTARGSLERRELLLVRLWTSDGTVGLGEAAPLALRGGAAFAEIREELDGIQDRLVGIEVGPESSPADLIEHVRRPGLSRQALAALDIALHDLVAKVRGEPVWRLLGAGRAASVRCNATLSTGSPDSVATEAGRWSESGFESFKLKVGAGEDVEQVRAVREALGPGAKLRVDANAAWDEQTAIETLQALEPLEVELAEQPVASLDEMASVAERISIPLAGDESVVTPDDGRAAAESGCTYATAKIAKVGGIAVALEVAASIPTYFSSALDGPVGIAAAAHAVQSAPPVSVAHGLATGLLFEEDIAASGPQLRGSLLTLNDSAGLGVVIDDAVLDELRL